MTDKERRTYHEWTEWLNAVRDGKVRYEEGAYCRVVYDSAYSDEPQRLEGELRYTSRGFGLPFTLDGKHVKGFTVKSDRRDIGDVQYIVAEVAEQGAENGVGAQ